MAEELPVELTNHDDMSVMRVLLHTVKGLSPISTSPELEAIPVDEGNYGEQFEFEQ